MTGHCPTINGQKPNEEFDLDNQTHLATLGYHQKNDLEKADKYVHYPGIVRRARFGKTAYGLVRAD